MMSAGEMASYAEARAHAHATRARGLASLAQQPTASPSDVAWLDALCALDPFLVELSSPVLRGAFDPWR
jgi:1,4-alpha-glucan branching enzyme